MHINEEFIVAGKGGQRKAIIAATDGAGAEVYLQGAHVTSWIPAGDTERLFVSPRSEFKPGAAIRGGVPLIFPQFANEGPLPKHGFARTAQWELVPVSKKDIAEATFRLSSSPATEAIWPHAFVAEFVVSVGGRSLDLTLRVANTGSSAFSFTSALHTYLGVADSRRTIVRGLEGLSFRDSTAGGARRQEIAPQLAIVGEVNRIYRDVTLPLTVEEPDRITTIDMEGFTDVVVWNPGPTTARTFSDMEPDGYLRMLCIEAAAIETPVMLEPEQRWSGRQRLSVP